MQRTVVFKVNADGTVSPAYPQCAGIQGEDRATAVVFDLTDAGLETTGTTYVYRVEFVSGASEWDTTDVLLSPTGNLVTAPLLRTWTLAGGRAVARLVITRLEDGTQEEQTVLSADAPLYFRTKEEAALAGGACEKGLTRLILEVRDAQASAQAAGTLAQEMADDLAARRDAGEFKGDTGPAGPAGADGCGLLPVANLATSTTSNGDHIYEVSLGTDYTALPDAFMVGFYLSYGLTAADKIRLYGNGLLWESAAATVTPSTLAAGYHLFAYDGGKLYEIAAKGDRGEPGELTVTGGILDCGYFNE